MRALCGSIIAAGALIGLGLATIGIGTRYQNWPVRNPDNLDEIWWVRFSWMDSSLIFTLVALVAGLVIGLGIAFVGLAYHHQRRLLERDAYQRNQRVSV